MPLSLWDLTWLLPLTFVVSFAVATVAWWSAEAFRRYDQEWWD